MVNLLDTSSGILPNGKVKVPPAPKRDKRTPVRVNGTEIPADTIREEAQLHPADNPGAAIKEATRALIVRELLLQRATATGIVAEPESLGEGRREADADAAIRALLDAEVVTPTANEQACRRYYNTHPEKFCSETLYEARHILFAAPLSNPAARNKAKLEAEQVIAELERFQDKWTPVGLTPAGWLSVSITRPNQPVGVRQNKDLEPSFGSTKTQEALKQKPDRFAILACLHSACPSREMGGNLGQLTKGSTVPEFEAVLFTLEPGQMSPEPAETRFGYHIILLERLIKGERLPYGAAQERVAAWLEASSWSRGVSQYISLLVGQAKIEGFDMEGADSPLVQ